jgi:protein ImuA
MNRRRKHTMPAAIQLFAEPSVPLMCSPDQALLASLRASIERIDGAGAAGGQRSREALPLGVPQIDAVLPGGGLPRDCLHEIVAADAGASATGFSAVLLARLAGEDSVIWCRRDAGLHGVKLYGSGVAAFGLDLHRLLLVRVRREIEVLWAMEEGLRSGSVSAVLGEAATVSPIALRRLQLAAETGGATGLLLRPPGAALAHGGAASGWRVASAPSPLPLRGSHILQRGEDWVEDRRPGIRWRVELLRCRATAPASWLLDWCDETHRLRVVAELRDRPAAQIAAEYERRA